MFKFNFSGSEAETSGSKNNDEDSSRIKWEPAKKLDLNIEYNWLTSFDPTEVSSYYRVMNLHGLYVKILKREIALKSIGRDTLSPQCTVIAETNNSDLEVAKYEGGLKVWECSEDLGAYLVNELTEKHIVGKDVLDLGCGSGIIGILALLLGANSVTFQDYNSEVLAHWTSRNVSLNIPENQRGNNEDRCKFWSGDWGDFPNQCDEKFDLVLTSETIYNPDNYEKLCHVLNTCTKPSSTIYLAAKGVYFSLGGSVPLFLEHLDRSHLFSHRQVFKTDEGVQRVIVEIKRTMANS